MFRASMVASMPNEEVAPGEKSWDLRHKRSRQLNHLRGVATELGELARRGRKMVRRSANAQECELPDLDTLCSFAARIQTAPPSEFPLTPLGWPAEPLPQGFELPHPSVQGDILKSMLRSSHARAPPPVAEVTAGGGSSVGMQQLGDLWTVRLKPLAPATSVLYTVDGSLPRTGNAAARRITAAASPDDVISLKPGGTIIAVALGQRLRVSDFVTLSVPRPPAHAPAAVALQSLTVAATPLPRPAAGVVAPARDLAADTAAAPPLQATLGGHHQSGGIDVSFRAPAFAPAASGFVADAAPAAATAAMNVNTLGPGDLGFAAAVAPVPAASAACSATQPAPQEPQPAAGSPGSGTAPPGPPAPAAAAAAGTGQAAPPKLPSFRGGLLLSDSDESSEED